MKDLNQHFKDLLSEAYSDYLDIEDEDYFFGDEGEFLDTVFFGSLARYYLEQVEAMTESGKRDTEVINQELEGLLKDNSYETGIVTGFLEYIFFQVEGKPDLLIHLEEEMPPLLSSKLGEVEQFFINMDNDLKV